MHSIILFEEGIHQNIVILLAIHQIYYYLNILHPNKIQFMEKNLWAPLFANKQFSSAAFIYTNK